MEKQMCASDLNAAATGGVMPNTANSINIWMPFASATGTQSPFLPKPRHIRSFYIRFRPAELVCVGTLLKYHYCTHEIMPSLLQLLLAVWQNLYSIEEHAALYNTRQWLDALLAMLAICTSTLECTLFELFVSGYFQQENLSLAFHIFLPIFALWPLWPPLSYLQVIGRNGHICSQKRNLLTPSWLCYDERCHWCIYWHPHQILLSLLRMVTVANSLLCFLDLPVPHLILALLRPLPKMSKSTEGWSW